MAWKNGRFRWNRHPETCERSTYDFEYGRYGGYREGRKYRKHVDHKPKLLSEEERQRREWQREHSQWRERRNWRRGWKFDLKRYCARNHRAWVRMNLRAENWDVFHGGPGHGNWEYNSRENPWNWD